MDVKQEKCIDDYWNIDGSRDFSDPWTGFTQFTLLEEKPPDGYMWSGWEINEKTAHIQARSSMKQKWSDEKFHLANARKLRGIYFIDPEDTEFKETIKNARKKLETSVALAMPCKIMKNCGSGASNKIKTKLACIPEADMNLRECVWEIRYRIIMKTILQGKVKNHFSTTTWFKFIPMPQAMKIPAAKAAVDKECEKLEKISAWNLTKVRSKKEVSMKQGRRAQKFILPH